MRDKYWKTHSLIISENFTIIFTFLCKFHVRDKLQNHCQNRKINFLFGKPTPLISYAEQFKSSNLIEFHWKVKKERLIWPTIKLKVSGALTAFTMQYEKSPSNWFFFLCHIWGWIYVVLKHKKELGYLSCKYVLDKFFSKSFLIKIISMNIMHFIRNLCSHFES